MVSPENVKLNGFYSNSSVTGCCTAAGDQYKQMETAVSNLLGTPVHMHSLTQLQVMHELQVMFTLRKSISHTHTRKYYLPHNTVHSF